MDQETAEPPWPEFPDFVASRARHLLRTAFLLTGGDAHLAEDLVQEALGRIYLKWRKISRLDNPSGYAQAVLVNTFLSYRRKRSASERVTDEFPEVGVHDPDPALRLTLLRALAELPAPDRAVLVLRFWEDRSVEETAVALRLSGTAVRTRCRRALVRLRAVLGDDIDTALGGSAGTDRTHATSGPNPSSEKTVLRHAH